MKLKSTITGGLAVLALGLALAGCSSNGNTAEKGSQGLGKPPVAVEVLAVSPTELSEGIEVVGSLAPKFEAGLKSEVQGLVAEVFVTEWVRVKKGQPLARLDTREANVLVQKAAAAVEASKANQLQTEVALRRAKREHQRLLKLKDVGLVTAQALDDATTEEEAAAARLAATDAQLKVASDDLSYARTKLDKIMIVSPMDGVVSFRGVSAGDMVGEAGSSKVMFKVVDPSLLDLTVTVPSKEMRLLALGQPLSFTTDAFPGRTFTGKVMFINPSVSEGDRSLKVVAEVPNADGALKGGLFVRGRIIVASRPEVLQVPRSALLAWDVAARQAELYVTDGQVAQHRRVATGVLAGEMVEITQGLKPGEQIITRGGFNLKDGDKVKITGGGA